MILGILLVFLYPTPALAAETENWEDTLDISAYEDMLVDLDQMLETEDVRLTELWQEFRQGETSDFWQQLPGLLGDMFFSHLKDCGKMLSAVLALSLFAVLLTMLKDNSSGQAAEVSRWVIYLLLLAIAILGFDDAVSAARQGVEQLSALLMGSLPIILPLLAAMGGSVTVTTISPLLLGGVEIMMLIMSNIIFPLLYFAGILRVVGCMTSRFPISGLADLFHDFSLGLMSIVSTVFIAILGFVGVAGASIDGLTMKAAKTAAGAFIPVVGRTLSDVMDSLLGTALLLKNAIGLAGVVAILLICATPAIRLLLQSLIFRITGALIQPLGEKELSQALTGMGKSLTKLFAALAICGLFAFFTMALVVGLGMVTMMMR